MKIDWFIFTYAILTDATALGCYDPCI